ncbi:hypothetical protein [Saccharopolyspora cebuensis]|uniref:Uncharacterized protein n=1 Tax=Saccharopolyspora cebuensis TaxID=418759 RepID=A0ABV4CF34_9PSEU
MADWMRDAGEQSATTAGQVQSARSVSEGAWAGTAAEAARAFMAKAGGQIEDIAAAFADMAAAMRVHADDIDTVLTKMEEARRVAIEGRLVIKGDYILGPGAAPAAPLELPSQPTPSDELAHSAAVRAQAVYLKQVKSFVEATEIVDDARKKENESQGVLAKYFDNYWEKKYFNAADTLTAAAGGVVARTSKFVGMAARLEAQSNALGTWANDAKFSAAARLQMSILQVGKLVEKQEATRRAFAGYPARFLGKSPKWLKVAVTASVVPKQSRIANALPLLKRVPVIGAALTTTTSVLDIVDGKNPVQVIAAGVGSLGAGALAGAALASAPVTVAVLAGAVVSTGVGFLVEEYGDEAYEWMAGVGDKLAEINPKMTR